MLHAARFHDSVFLVTLDSCRYDTFAAAKIPNLKNVGSLFRAKAPSYFTFASHAAMFVGFTPGVAELQVPYANPKFAKIFKMRRGGSRGQAQPRFQLDGRNIIDGFKKLGYLTIGTGAMPWFDPETETGQVLCADFDEFFYPGRFRLEDQVQWLTSRLESRGDGGPVFCFINVGETHVPYYFRGAQWDQADNPCVPFSSTNNADTCRVRQTGCLEYVDKQLAPLLGEFEFANTLICADHGDCWGEDGLWEHGIAHEKVFEVPLVFRINAAV